MMDKEPIGLYADIDDHGRLIIERQDGQAISIITNDDLNEECIEVLEYGCSGHATKALQCLLNAHGEHLEEDGIFGNLTQDALLNFQDRNRLNKTGVCDMLTYQKLIRS